MIVKFYRHLVTIAIMLLLPFFSGTCRGEPRQKQLADEIVASILEAYGGADSIRKVLSVTATGRITEFMNGKVGNYSRYFEQPGKLRIEVMPEQGGDIRILNGNSGWQRRGEGFVRVSPLELQSMIYQYSYLDLPMAFGDKEFLVTYGGKFRQNGEEVYLLLLETKNSPQLRVLIDARTRLIARVSAKFAMGMMGDGELSTTYSDYHAVDGVLFPHTLVNYAGDMKLSEIKLGNIKVNQKIPAAFFAPRVDQH